MVEISKLVNLARLGVVGFVSFLSIINLALSAHIIHFTTRTYGGYFNGTALTLATAILSLFTLPALVFIGMTRNGALPNYIAVEVGWFWFLWIMWLASAAETTALWVTGRGSIIGEFRAAQAFSFLNWLALMFYTTTLFILAITSHVKGNQGVWTSTVKDFDFDAAINKSAQQNATGAQSTFTAPQFEQKTGTTDASYYPPQQVGTPQPQQFAQQPYPQQPVGYAGQPMQTAPVPQV